MLTVDEYGMKGVEVSWSPIATYQTTPKPAAKKVAIHYISHLLDRSTVKIAQDPAKYFNTLAL